MSLQDFIKGRSSSLKDNNTEAVGIGGFLLAAVVNETTDYTATLPQFTLEDGSNAIDHIINNPITVKISGVVGAKWIKLEPINPVLGQVEAISGLAQSLVPKYQGAMLSKINAIRSQVTDVSDRVNNFADTLSPLLGGQPSKPDYEKFIDFIEAVYYGQAPVKLQTRSRLHEDMALKTLSVRRDNTSDAVQFDATFQKIKTVKLEDADITAFFPKPAAGSGAGGVQEKGAQDLADSKKNESLLSAIFR